MLKVDGSVNKDYGKIKKRKKEDIKKWKEMKLVKEFEKELKRKEKKLKMIKKVEGEGEVSEETKAEETGSQGIPFTVSLAVPGSIMDNAQSQELRTYLAGQIARAAVIFKVSEIIVFSDRGRANDRCDVQLGRILQYLECPQYLRKQYFPQHQDLQYAGLLNPLDSPHHMRVDDASEYREGCVLEKPCKPGKGSYANCGMRREVQVDRRLDAGVRVTVKLKPGKKARGMVVSPTDPLSSGGVYWGYTVRLADCISSIFSQCPYPNPGYDLTIGTSEKGADIDGFHINTKFKHMLVVFGGVSGLETALECDERIDVNNVSSLFSHYLNLCPRQGSRTIRTEEAILIGLSSLRPKICEVYPTSAINLSNGN